MRANQLKEGKDWTILCFDAGKSSLDLFQEKILGKMKKTVSQDGIVQYAKIGTEDAKKFQTTTVNVGFMLLLIAIVGVLVFLNIFSASRHWVKGKSKEIAVRKLVGATNWGLYRWLVKEYIILLISSTFVGVLVAEGFLTLILRFRSISTIQIMFSNQIHFIGIASSIGGILIIGIATITSVLFRMNQRQIIENVRY